MLSPRTTLRRSDPFVRTSCPDLVEEVQSLGFYKPPLSLKLWDMEVHFEDFWGLLAIWSSGCFWSFMLSLSQARWPNFFREISGDTFSAFLGFAGSIVLSRLLEGRFEDFWGSLAKWLSGGFWIFILSISGIC